MPHSGNNIISLAKSFAKYNGVSFSALDMAEQIDNAIMSDDVDAAHEGLVQFYRKIIERDVALEIGDDEIKADCNYWLFQISRLFEKSPAAAFGGCARSLLIFREHHGSDVHESLLLSGLGAMAVISNKLDVDDEEYRRDVLDCLTFAIKLCADKTEDTEDFYQIYHQLFDPWLTIFSRITPEERFSAVENFQIWAESYPESVPLLDSFVGQMMSAAYSNAQGNPVITTEAEEIAGAGQENLYWKSPEHI